MNPLSLNQKQQGLTLIEILIALVLGTFLLAGVLQIFQSSKRSYRMQENMSRMQENGRFAMEFISQDIRMTDYRVCYNDANDPVIGGVAGAIIGTNDLGLNNSDTITVAQKTNACGAADATSTITYDIRTFAANGQPTLYKNTGALAQPLVEGIEDMQILYGEDTDADGTPNYYVNSATVVNMAAVVSARITLTARTIDTNLTNTGDGRLRQTYTSTLGLRNRL